MGRFRERASVNLFCLKHAAFFSLLIDDLWVPGYYSVFRTQCKLTSFIGIFELTWAGRRVNRGI